MKDWVTPLPFIKASRDADDLCCELFEPGVLGAAHADNTIIVVVIEDDFGAKYILVSNMSKNLKFFLDVFFF